MLLIGRIVLCLALCCGLGACFQADIDTVLFDDGAGKFDILLSVHRSKLPALFGDPLAGVGEVDDLRRYGRSGIVAWAEPRRLEADGWERVQLTAFFDDINRVRFFRTREDRGVELLGFDYDAAARPGSLLMRVDMEPELAAPLPLPEREGLDLSPDILRQLFGMLRPLLGDLRLSLRFHAPSAITRASGFRGVEGRTAEIVADRDRVLQALQEESAVLLDAPAFVAEGASIDWLGEVVAPSAEWERFQAERAAARNWWEKQLAADR